MEKDYQEFFSLFTQISKKIHANSDTKDILSCIVENITQLMSAKGCVFWILNTQKQKIETRIFNGFDYRSLLRVDYVTLMNIFSRPKDNRVYIGDARNDPRIPDLERLGKHKINSISGLFFDITGPYTGLLAVYFYGSRPLKTHELELLTALGEQGAIALEKAIAYDNKMLTMYRQIVEGFALAIEARDKATHGHSQRVARFSELTAREMGLDEKNIKNIFHAGILHDIGKIGTDDQILERLGHLSTREMDAIRRHPGLGADILSPLTFFSDIEPLVRHHHELFDGSGYPDGKKGEKIPLGARIITVCDAFETMVAGRASMPKLSLSAAVSALKKGVGTRFDPDVVQAFFAVIRENPDIVDAQESIDDCLKDLKQNMADLAGHNLLEKKFSSFPGGF